MILLIVLISLTKALELYGESCVVGSSNCVELKDLKSCVLISGVLSNRTCAESGTFNLGRCCNNGNCIISTSFACVYGGGVWKSGEECPCENVPSSCCIESGCSEDYDAVQCAGAGGNFLEGQPCAKQACVMQEHHLGACCRSGDICKEIPSQYCDGDWSSGQTCADVGCGDPNPVPYYGENSTKGRCCSGGCYTFHTEESCKADISQFWEADYGCNQYPCIPKGACIKYPLYCQDQIPVSLCYSLGGTFIPEGSCNAGTLGRCDYGEGCNIYSQEYCISNGGSWTNETECPVVGGACCLSRTATCKNWLNTWCPIQDGRFSPGKTCDEIVCVSGSCCLSEICIGQSGETQCLSFEDSYYRNETCGETGACKDIVTIIDRVNSFIYPVNVQDIRISASNSNFNFTSVSIIRTNFSVTKSQIHLDNFELSSSVLNIDSSSKLTISGCFNVESTSLNVEVDEDGLETLQNGEPITLAQYQCKNGDPTVNIKVNGEENSCITASFTSIFQISYRGDCLTDTDSNDPTQNQMSGTFKQVLSSLLFLMSIF